MNNTFRNRVDIALFGVLAYLLYLIITHVDMGLTPDGCSYFEMTKSIISNVHRGGFLLQGISHHFPPLYPLILAILTSTGLTLLQSAKILGLLMFIVNGYLYYFIILKRTKSHGVAIIVSWAILSMLILIFASALTEPLFYVFVILFLLLMESDNEVSWKTFIIFLLASLLRYAGITLFLTYILVLLLKHKKKSVRIKGILIGLLFQIPIIIYALSGDGIGGREISLKLKGIVSFMVRFVLIPFNIFISFDNIGYLGLSSFCTRLMKLIGIGIVAIGIYWPIVKYFSHDIKALKKQCLKHSACLFIVVYTIFILVSRLFIDGSIPANLRIFSPVLVALLFVFPVNLLKTKRGVITTLYLVVLFTLGGATVYKLYVFGKDYTSIRWKRSEVIDFIRKKGLIDTCKVYSNAPEVVQLYTGKTASLLPKMVLPSAGHENLSLTDDMKKVCDGQDCRIIIYFKEVKHRWFLVDPLYVQRHCRVEKVFKLLDGTIFMLK